MALEKKIQDAYRDLSKENDGATLADVWDVIRPKAGTSAKPRSAKIVDWINHYVKSSPTRRTM